MEKLIHCSLNASTTTQTLNLLRQIINMNSTIDNTQQMLENMQLLQPIFKLSQKLFDKIIYVLKNFITFSHDDPSSLVTSIRIIEREEKIDEYWKKNHNSNESQTSYMPPGRPKKWASYIDNTICDTIYEEITKIKSNINFDDKLALTEYLEKICNYVIKNIISIQTYSVRCFPPSYQILARVSTNYHKVIKEIIEKEINDLGANPKEIDVVSILLFEKQYLGEKLFGNKKLDPCVIYAIQNSEPLLSAIVIEKWERNYLADVCENLTSKVHRIVGIEKRYMEGDTLPVILNQKYVTLSSSFYDDFVFLNTNVLGFGNFANLFKSERINNSGSHRDKYFEKFPYFVQYCIAIANNCIQIKNSVDQLCKDYVDEISNIPENSIKQGEKSFSQWIGEEYTNRLSNITNQIEDFSKKCIITISNDYISDLKGLFDDFLGPKWKENALAWSEGFQGTLINFMELLRFLDQTYISSVLAHIDKGISQKYLNRFLNYKTKYSSEQISTFGELIWKDGIFLSTFFAKNCSIKEEDTYSYTIVACASAFKHSDHNCALMDLPKIFKKYSDFTKEHAFALLIKRLDLSKDKINETIRVVLEGRKISSESKFGVFNEIKISSSIF
ncbi:hypothetical protein MXB_3130 [Myxobolus squamalis]|nr:hypothetical protein MXB_3130 [Myxobolus squamalis]